MNGKPGETPNPFSMGQPGGSNSNNSDGVGNTFSPSNFGARQAQRPEMATSSRPTPSMDNLSQGINSASFQSGVGNGADDNMMDARPGGAAEINAFANGTSGGMTPGEMMNDEMRPDGTNASSTGVVTSAPSNSHFRPMEKAAPVMPEADKNAGKKKGLIIGAICGVAALLIIVAVGIAVAFSASSADPVAGAIEKILSGKAPANLQINGNIAFDTTDESSPATHYEMTVSASGIPNSMINEATMTIPLGNEFGNATVEIDEIYAGSGDLYLRTDGVSAALEGLGNYITMHGGVYTGGEEELQYECEEGDEECEAMLDESTEVSEEELTEEGEVVYSGEEVDPLATFEDNTLLTLALMLAQNVEGEWVKIPVGSTSADEQDASEIESTIRDNGGDVSGIEDATCEFELFNKLRTNSSTVAGLYRKNAFISSTRDKVTLAKKNYPVYQVVFDNERLANFVSGAQEAGLMNEYYTCSGQNANGVVQTIMNLPAIYVEVDNDLNFTRLYVKGNTDGTTITADLGFTYPTNVNVPEPTEYLDLQEAMEGMFSGMFIEEGTEEISE